MRQRKPIVTYERVMRNAGFNLGSRALVALVAIPAIPLIIRGLGLELYGILSLILVLVGYFTLLDFGLDDATTKVVAETLGGGRSERLASLIWTSLILMTGLGVLAGAMLCLATPLLVGRILKISAEFGPEARTCFYLMGAALPFMLLSSGLRGLFEAKQRYDLVNLVSVPASVLNYAMPVAVLAFHGGLVAITVALVLGRAGNCLTYFLICRHLYPELHQPVEVDLRGARSLVVFGGWLTISSLTWSVTLYVDRLIIGALLPVSMLPFYSAPLDAVARLWILPASWVAIYPAFSAIGRERHEELASLFGRGLKHVALLLGPVVIVAIFFAGGILRVWLGKQFEMESTAVFQILAVGVLVNSLSTVPDLLIKGIGRFDLIAKLRVVQLLPYTVLLYVLVKEWGIVGAAAAWAVRALVDTVVIFVMAHRLVPTSARATRSAGMARLALSLSGLAAAMWVAVSFFTGAARIGMGASFLIVSAVLMWRLVLDHEDRNFFRAALKIEALDSPAA